MQTRGLYEDMGLAPNGVETTLRWKDLALESLLPSNDKKEMEKKVSVARRLATGVPISATAPPPAIVDDADSDSSADEDEDYGEQESTDEDTEEDTESEGDNLGH